MSLLDHQATILAPEVEHKGETNDDDFVIINQERLPSEPDADSSALHQRAKPSQQSNLSHHDTDSEPQNQAPYFEYQVGQKHGYEEHGSCSSWKLDRAHSEGSDTEENEPEETEVGTTTSSSTLDQDLSQSSTTTQRLALYVHPNAPSRRHADRGGSGCRCGRCPLGKYFFDTVTPTSMTGSDIGETNSTSLLQCLQNMDLGRRNKHNVWFKREDEARLIQDIPDVINLQAHQGYWPMSPRLSHLFNFTALGVQAEFLTMLELYHRMPNQMVVLATVWALGFIGYREVAGKRRSEMVRAKAHRWLNNVLTAGKFWGGGTREYGAN